MKKLVLVLGSLLVMAGCGRKQDDQGPQFSVRSISDFKALETGVPIPAISREDENAGPSYKLEGDLASVEYFDKKLICGPMTVGARRALKTDSSFFNFKISEAEFHGLNMLPQHAQCVLAVTSANGNGSTVTKTSQVDLKLDTSPSLKIIRQFIAPGGIDAVAGSLLLMDYYEITNPLPYTVPLIYKPLRTALVAPSYGGLIGQFTELYVNDVQFEPSNFEFIGSVETGYKFRLASGASVKLRASTRLPGQWVVAPGNCTTSPLTGLVISAGRETGDSLIQAEGFDFGPNDLLSGRRFNYKQLVTAPFKMKNSATTGVLCR